MPTWDVFISHASEDKDEVATPLAAALTRAGLRVWLDRQELRLGDSLHEKIDEGLADSRFGIVVLSPSFLAKRFPRKELNGLSAIEDAHRRKVILPVWHHMDAETLARHSPLLADRLAVDTADGMRTVVARILDTVMEGPIAGDRTPARLLQELLDRAPDRATLVDFFALHPALIHGALHTTGEAGHWSVTLGPASVDLCASRQQHTTNEVTWFLVQFAASGTAAVVGGEVAAEVRARADDLRAVRRWISRNLRPARMVLPGISVGFEGIVVAGRRHLLSPDDSRALRQYHDELPGTTVRTYDWVIDAATQTTWQP
ncbi:toll/interleukin-1 receptor domain-containing protein [Dactylosporangium sp. NPDC049525]|uniref:toll/interleukin-1 receptor domain-containing protein n=1 Tax=Dactylosporangium sp. NPDC049525 TaxID=3154730 RepID=UPI0034259D74